jgi:hypothetical protein
MRAGTILGRTLNPLRILVCRGREGEEEGGGREEGREGEEPGRAQSTCQAAEATNGGGRARGREQGTNLTDPHPTRVFIMKPLRYQIGCTIKIPGSATLDEITSEAAANHPSKK